MTNSANHLFFQNFECEYENYTSEMRSATTLDLAKVKYFQKIQGYWKNGRRAIFNGFVLKISV